MEEGQSYRTEPFSLGSEAISRQTVSGLRRIAGHPAGLGALLGVRKSPSPRNLVSKLEVEAKLVVFHLVLHVFPQKSPLCGHWVRAAWRHWPREWTEQAGVAVLGELVYEAAGQRREGRQQLAFLGKKRGPVREKFKEKRFGGVKKISLSSCIVSSLTLL